MTVNSFLYVFIGLTVLRGVVRVGCVTVGKVEASDRRGPDGDVYRR